MKRFIVIIFIFVPIFTLESQLAQLEKIVLYGNTKTDDNVILRELQLKERDLFSDTHLLYDRAWLIRQGYFKRVEYQLKPGSTDQQRILMIIVQEKGSWSVSPVLSNNDLFGWYVGGRIVRNHLAGKRNQMGISFQIGGVNQFVLSWGNPWIGDRLRLFAEMELSYTAFRYLYGDYDMTPFHLQKTEMKMTLGRQFNRELKIGIGTGIERFGVTDPNVTFSGGRVDWLSHAEPFIQFDSRDWPLYPQKGLFIQVWSTWYGIFQHRRFQYHGMDFRFYSPLYHDNVLAMQTTFEFSRGEIPVYKRIHLGGGRTIRGYSTGSLPGENSFLMSLEYRVPILYERNPLAGVHVGYAGVLFVDTATTWYQNQTMRNDMIRLSVGLGVHVIWDHWIFRAEYGNHGSGWGFVNLGSGIKF
ncbi:BamA/TamA family outer membrane protein [bacterium]|nr:BamA/TamA family outer membrane protein [bacterium]